MYGILAIDFGTNTNVALCTKYEENERVVCTFPNRQEATKVAAETTEWYQRDIRPNVVYTAIPLPLY